MTIHLITFASALLKQQAVLGSHETLLNELEKYFTVRIVDPDHIRLLMPSDFAVIFMASGGVERQVISRFDQLPRPLVILADGMQNSLASALEIHSWLHNKNDYPYSNKFLSVKKSKSPTVNTPSSSSLR